MHFSLALTWTHYWKWGDCSSQLTAGIKQSILQVRRFVFILSVILITGYTNVHVLTKTACVMFYNRDWLKPLSSYGRDRNWRRNRNRNQLSVGLYSTVHYYYCSIDGLRVLMSLTTHLASRHPVWSDSTVERRLLICFCDEPHYCWWTVRRITICNPPYCPSARIWPTSSYVGSV